MKNGYRGSEKFTKPRARRATKKKAATENFIRPGPAWAVRIEIKTRARHRKNTVIRRAQSAGIPCPEKEIPRGKKEIKGPSRALRETTYKSLIHSRRARARRAFDFQQGGIRAARCCSYLRPIVIRARAVPLARAKSTFANHRGPADRRTGESSFKRQYYRRLRKILPGGGRRRRARAGQSSSSSKRSRGRRGERESKELNRGREGGRQTSDEQIIEFNCKTVGMI